MHATRTCRGSAASAAASKVKPFQPAKALLSCRAASSAVQPNAPHSATISASRRDVITAAPGLAALAGLAAAGPVVAPGSAAAAAPTCDFISSPSGLQYCDVTVGDGPEPAKGSLIRCHYTGRLASNNVVFDSSYERRRPLSFKIGVREVIQGWDLGILGTEGIPAMREGGKRILLIPSALGYGSRGAGGVIPPNAELLFEVELLGKPGRR